MDSTEYPQKLESKAGEEFLTKYFIYQRVWSFSNYIIITFCNPLKMLMFYVRSSISGFTWVKKLILDNTF